MALLARLEIAFVAADESTNRVPRQTASSSST